MLWETFTSGKIWGQNNAFLWGPDYSIFHDRMSGMRASYDGSPGFQDDGGQKTDIAQALKTNGIKNVIVYRIATDYCVQTTAVDAADAGFKVVVVEGL